jgi:thiamine biosynthesis lipoprotein
MKKIMVFLLLSLISIALLGCVTTETTRSNPDDRFCALNAKSGAYLCASSWTSYFDTTISLSLYYQATDTYTVADVFTETGEILKQYHELFDKYHAYPGIENVFSINADSSVPDGILYGTTVISQELYDALDLVLANENKVTSGGVELFNVALSPILSLWHEARDGETCYLATNLVSSVCVPPEEALLDSLYNTDSSDIVMDPEALTIAFQKPGMGLDLGGYGKGYVSEILTDWLDGQSLTYLLNAGNSNIKAGGTNPNREDGHFYIALTQPTFTLTLAASYFAYLRIPSGLSIVTSGSYQNYFVGETDDLIYHHIVDPRTNHPGGDQITLTFDENGDPVLTPAGAVMSVSILCENGAFGDIYSTSVFLLSFEEGLAFIESEPDLEAIWFQYDGTITLSSGLSLSEIEISTGVFKPLILVD